MKLTVEEATDVVYNSHEDWSMVKGTKKTVDNSRWSIIKEAIFVYKPTGKFYEFNWACPATEMQEQDPFCEEFVEPVEVIEKEVMIKQWVPVEPS